MKISIIGTVGVPGKYGGFETLAENLVEYHAKHCAGDELTVYCSAKAYPDRAETFRNAHLRYIPLDANGAQSIPYDIWSIFAAVRSRSDVILLLGVSGALILPLIKLVSSAKIITNIDGIESKRGKWGGIARLILKWSEASAIRWSHIVIADNQGIADYVSEQYKRTSTVIAYGGDHAIAEQTQDSVKPDRSQKYALSLCRIEPENNVHVILEAWEKIPTSLVFVGNWNNSEYGKGLKEKYATYPNIQLLDPVYDPRELLEIRSNADIYVHGHSAGGTNPSLVEMMHFDIPILAYDCNFNRHTTENQATYFLTAHDLAQRLLSPTENDFDKSGAKMGEIARRRYTWDQIGREYFELM